ncbi:MAG: hypothetical protein GY927_14480 [bacterium]|nr:hypothetical protein [bacterium]
MNYFSRASFIIVSIIIVLFVALVSVHYRASPKYISWKSLEIAVSIHRHSVFTNGGKIDNKTPGYYHAPGYPAMMAALAWLVPSTADDMSCLASKRRNCQQKTFLHILIATQIFASLITLGVVFLLAFELSGSREIAVLTLLFFMFSAGLSKFSSSLLPFVFVTLAITASSYSLLLSYRRSSIFFAILAGAFSGIGALFYPPYAIVPLFTSLALFVASRALTGRGLLLALALLLGTVLVLSPWLFRNYLLFEEIAIASENIKKLAMRVAYNSMTTKELLASFIIWLPNFGEGLANILFAPEIIERFEYGKGTIIGGYSTIYSETKHSREGIGHFEKIVYTHIYTDFFAYLSALPTLFLRGFWGGSTLGIFGVIFLWSLQKRLRKSGDFMPYLLVFASLASTVLAHAMLVGSNNPHHYTSHILFLHAYSISYVTGGLELPRILRKIDG